MIQQLRDPKLPKKKIQPKQAPTFRTHDPASLLRPPPTMESIPANLKPAEIARFMHRANQLRQVKPAITYWCASPRVPPNSAPGRC